MKLTAAICAFIVAAVAAIMGWMRALQTQAVLSIEQKKKLELNKKYRQAASRAARAEIIAREERDMRAKLQDIHKRIENECRDTDPVDYIKQRNAEARNRSSGTKTPNTAGPKDRAGSPNT